LKPASFEYHSPSTVAEVVQLLATHGDDAKILAGGQSLVPLMNLRLVTPSVLIDLNRVAELDFLTLDKDSLRIGALTRHRDVEKLDGLDRRCPMVAEAVGLVGHVAVRNRGTVVGSLTHADPSAEWLALSLVLDGRVIAVGPDGSRTIAAEDFFVTTMTTTLSADEVATELVVSLPSELVTSTFVELSRRPGDFALAGVAAAITLDDVGNVNDARIAIIGVEERPRRMHEAEELLRGEDPIAAALDAAESVFSEVEPRDDIHGTANFRRSIVRVLTRRAILIAAERASGRIDV
jgi:aerobic carbon-monoxide dehydrogenase medium subunit